MKLNYKRLGDYIRQIDVRNKDLKVKNLLGVSVDKIFIPSHANTNGTDFKNYKIVTKGQFAYGPVTSRNGDKISIALLEDCNECLVSSSYITFEIIDENKLNPKYLTLLFTNPEFDRFARYNSWGSAREVFSWEDFCDSELYIPNIEEQNKIIYQYESIYNRISFLENMNSTLMFQANIIFNKYYGDYLDYDEVDSELELEYGTLDSICDFINGYAFESDEMKDCKFENSYAVFKQGNIKKGGGINHLSTKSWVTKKEEKKLEKYVLRKNDILMAMTDMKESISLLGHTAIMDVDDEYILNQRVGLLRANNYKDTSSYYLYLITNNKIFLEKLRQQAHYGVQVNLSKDDIMNSKVVILPPNINRQFNKEVENNFKLMFLYNQEILLLKDCLDKYVASFV